VTSTRQDCLGDTVLHLAAGAGDLHVVKFLAEQWPEGIMERGHSLNMPLHSAARMGKTDVARILAERWPEGKEAFNSDWETPLWLLEKYARQPHPSDHEKDEIIYIVL
jgi:ankyrin repeat protein